MSRLTAREAKAISDSIYDEYVNKIYDEIAIMAAKGYQFLTYKDYNPYQIDIITKILTEDGYEVSCHDNILYINW